MYHDIVYAMRQLQTDPPKLSLDMTMLLMRTLRDPHSTSGNTSVGGYLSGKPLRYLGGRGKQPLLKSLVHGILGRKLGVFSAEVHDERFQSLCQLVVAGSLRRSHQPATKKKCRQQAGDQKC